MCFYVGPSLLANRYAEIGGPQSFARPQSMLGRYNTKLESHAAVASTGMPNSFMRHVRIVTIDTVVLRERTATIFQVSATGHG
jgi:hypothetical protein